MEVMTKRTMTKMKTMKSKKDNNDDTDQGVVAPPARAGQPPLLAPPAAPDQQGAGQWHEDHYQERSLSRNIIIKKDHYRSTFDICVVS